MSECASYCTIKMRSDLSECALYDIIKMRADMCLNAICMI